MTTRATHCGGEHVEEAELVVPEHIGVEVREHEERDDESSDDRRS